MKEVRISVEFEVALYLLSLFSYGNEFWPIKTANNASSLQQISRRLCRVSAATRFISEI